MDPVSTNEVWTVAAIWLQLTNVGDDTLLIFTCTDNWLMLCILFDGHRRMKFTNNNCTSWKQTRFTASHWKHDCLLVGMFHINTFILFMSPGYVIWADLGWGNLGSPIHRCQFDNIIDTRKFNWGRMCHIPCCLLDY